MRSNDARYNLALILGHWLLTLMILISLGLGWYVQYVPQSSEVSDFLINTHTSFGVTIALLILILILLRLIAKAPSYPVINVPSARLQYRSALAQSLLSETSESTREPSMTQ